MRPVGRAPRTPNKVSAVRAEFLRAYYENNGYERLVDLLEEDKATFFRLFVAMVPKLRIQETRDTSGLDISEVSTAELLAVLGLTSVEQAEVDDAAGGNGEADEQ
jgi:hypothetical protein